MAYTSRQLIIDAYYTSGIVGRNYEFTTGDEINDGLTVLNDFLKIKGADIAHIPYYTVYDGVLTANQEVYYIQGLVEMESMTFFLPNPASPGQSSIRFQMNELTREQYFAYPRAEHIETLPLTWHMERAKGGVNLYVYFLPNQDYAYQIVGKFSLNQTALQQDLSTVYDDWYLTYLKYGLAIWLCNFRTVTPSKWLMDIFNEMKLQLKDLSPIDFTLRKQSSFKASSGGTTWGDVNYAHQWRSSN